jgi:hypothetical protein
VAGPACQWPTTAHGNVSRPACPRASREATVARARRCWPSRATCPSWSHALPCILIPSQCCFIKMKKPFASSSPRLCSLLRARSAPRCRASSPTGATLPHLKPPRQSLVRHGPPPSWSRHRAAVLCEKAPLHWVAAASAEGLTVECRHRPWNWCPSGTLSSAVAPRCSKAPPTPLATTGRSPHHRASPTEVAPPCNRLLRWAYPPWCTSIEFLNFWACSGHRPRPPIRRLSP